jgi:hypothetical protein
MSKPEIHARSSAKKYGGVIDDYLPLHNFMDSSKGAIPDNRHRFLLHNSWAIQPGGVLELIFGTSFVNSAGRTVQVRDIGEQHILEDFGNRFIPTVQDYLENMEYKLWMNNGAQEFPPSNRKLAERRKTVTIRTDHD